MKLRPPRTELESLYMDIVVVQTQLRLLEQRLRGAEISTKLSECSPQYGAEVHQTLLKTWDTPKTPTPPAGQLSD